MDKVYDVVVKIRENQQEVICGGQTSKNSTVILVNDRLFEKFSNECKIIAYEKYDPQKQYKDKTLTKGKYISVFCPNGQKIITIGVSDKYSSVIRLEEKTFVPKFSLRRIVKSFDLGESPIRDVSLKF